MSFSNEETTGAKSVGSATSGVKYPPRDSSSAHTVKREHDDIFMFTNKTRVLKTFLNFLLSRIRFRIAELKVNARHNLYLVFYNTHIIGMS